MYLVGSYLSYLLFSIAVTVWLARTLQQNGRIFLVDTFHGNEALADSINRLLVVSFCLINIGYISLILKSSSKPANNAELIDYLRMRIGIGCLVLGASLFLIVRVFSSLRRRALEGVHPPVAPSQQIAPEAV
jgi:hypothetical protein